MREPGPARARGSYHVPSARTPRSSIRQVHDRVIFIAGEHWSYLGLNRDRDPEVRWLCRWWRSLRPLLVGGLSDLDPAASGLVCVVVAGPLRRRDASSAALASPEIGSPGVPRIQQEAVSPSRVGRMQPAASMSARSLASCGSGARAGEGAAEYAATEPVAPASDAATATPRSNVRAPMTAPSSSAIGSLANKLPGTTTRPEAD